MAHINVSTMINEPPASALGTFRADPSVWLPLPCRRLAPRRWGLHVWVGVVAVPIEMTVGEPRREDGALRRLVRVTPSGTSRLGSYAPEVLGDLVVSLEDDRLALLLQATYRPPFGVIGQVGDRAGMRYLVTSSCQRLVDAVAANLGVSTANAPAVARRLRPRLAG